MHHHHAPLFQWREAFRERGTSGMAARSVGLALSLWAKMTNCEASRSQSELAEELDCDERTIRRALKQLTKDGWVERRRGQRGYVYTLTMPVPTGSSDRFQPDTESGSNRTQSPPDTESTGHRVRFDRTQDPVQPDRGSGPTYYGQSPEPRAGMHACRSDLEQAFADVGRRLTRDVDDHLDTVIDVAEELGAPWDYVIALVGDIGARVRGARPELLVEMVVDDLEAQKWLADPMWQEHQAAAAAAERIAEYSAAPTDEQLLEEAGPTLVEAWRRHIRQQVESQHGGSGPRADAYLDMLGGLDSLVASELRDGLVAPPEVDGD